MHGSMGAWEKGRGSKEKPFDAGAPFDKLRAGNVERRIRSKGLVHIGQKDEPENGGNGETGQGTFKPVIAS